MTDFQAWSIEWPGRHSLPLIPLNQYVSPKNRKHRANNQLSIENNQLL